MEHTGFDWVSSLPRTTCFISGRSLNELLRAVSGRESLLSGLASPGTRPVFSYSSRFKVVCGGLLKL